LAIHAHSCTFCGTTKRRKASLGTKSVDESKDNSTITVRATPDPTDNNDNDGQFPAAVIKSPHKSTSPGYPNQSPSPVDPDIYSLSSIPLESEEEDA